MSRGHILQWKYIDRTFEAEFELEKQLLTKITPNARVLVFYVDNNVVVADSVKFDVEAFFRGREVLVFVFVNKIFVINFLITLMLFL